MARREGAEPLAMGVVSTLRDAGGPRQIDDDARFAGPEQAEAKRLDDRVGAPRREASDRRIELKVHFREVDDDAIGIGHRVGARLDRPGKIEAQLRRFAVFGEARRDRDGRRGGVLGGEGRARQQRQDENRRGEAPPRHDRRMA